MMAKWQVIRKKLLKDPTIMEEYLKLPSVDIAAQIINARTKKGLTQAELAKLIGTSQSAIVRLERGTYTGYSLKTLLKVAKVLDSIIKVKFQPKSRAS